MNNSLRMLIWLIYGIADKNQILVIYKYGKYIWYQIDLIIRNIGTEVYNLELSSQLYH